VFETVSEPFVRRYLTERSYLLHGYNSARPGRLLRLPNNVWKETRTVLDELPYVASTGMPIEQLRLYQIVDSRVIQCWRGACRGTAGTRCSAWKVDEAAEILDSLTLEFRIAAEGGHRILDRPSSMQAVTLAIHAAWLRQ
jgi:hypothetical protein